VADHAPVDPHRQRRRAAIGGGIVPDPAGDLYDAARLFVAPCLMARMARI